MPAGIQVVIQADLRLRVEIRHAGLVALAVADPDGTVRPVDIRHLQRGALRDPAAGGVQKVHQRALSGRAASLPQIFQVHCRHGPAVRARDADRLDPAGGVAVHQFLIHHPGVERVDGHPDMLDSGFGQIALLLAAVQVDPDIVGRDLIKRFADCSEEPRQLPPVSFHRAAGLVLDDQRGAVVLERLGDAVRDDQIRTGAADIIIRGDDIQLLEDVVDQFCRVVMVEQTGRQRGTEDFVRHKKHILS